LSDSLPEYTEKIFNPSFIIEVLRSQKLALRKVFGQNLLINRELASRILDYGKLCGDDRVLEIGPGLGALTFLLAERVERVVAVEIDRGFVDYLTKKIGEYGIKDTQIIHDDFVSLRPEVLDGLYNPNKVISNFAYSIAIKSLIKIAESLPAVEMIVGTVQKELADRIAALPGTRDYSFVSVYLQYLMQVEVVEKRIHPQCFFPKPDVESSVVLLSRRYAPKSRDRALFKHVVKGAFAHRRKRIVSNLASTHGLPPVRDIERVIVAQVGDVSVRAEALSVEDFIGICTALKGYMKGTDSEAF
jgi:16S rRNA (adenine1518-N6/adenine1519-N6)-dimethyltransferase